MKKLLFVSILLISFSFTSFANVVFIKDLYDRDVTIPENITKTVALGPGTLRMIVYAGALNTIVGRELIEEKLAPEYRPYSFSFPQHFNNLPIVSDGGAGVMPNIDKLIVAAPDVIFANGFTTEQLNRISSLTNIPVIGITYGSMGHTDIEKIKESIRLIGYVTNTQFRTQAIANKMAMMRKDLYARMEPLPKKSVYMAGVSYNGANGFLHTERHHPSCELLGLKNISDETPDTAKGEHVIMRFIDIIQQNPDFIFFDIAGLNDLKKNYSKDYVELSQIIALKNRMAYTVMPYNWYNSNVENIFLNAYYIGKIIYPDSFADIDIDHLADDIYSVFLGVDPYAEVSEKHEAYRNILFEKNGYKLK